MESRWIFPFELLDKIGEGGMGVVYRARYVKNDKIVAVKLLPPDLDHKIIQQRFERELEILKTLRHPNIVYCFGGQTEGEQRFYAMELVDGGTLDDIIREEGKIPWGRTITLAMQMCSGLAYAHERGVIHRDIKPGNFLLTKQGKTKLADFGLATVNDAAKITAAGKTMGTVRYMAPEQIRGIDMTNRTDLYGLGCVLFEMLTGHTPFDGNSPAAIMQSHLEQPPPRVSDEVPTCPMDLDALVNDLLQKRPQDRPENAYIVGKRLAAISQVNILDRKNPIQQTPVAPSIPTPAPPRVPADRPVTASVSRISTGVLWSIPVLGLIIVALLFWNQSLLQQRELAGVSADLWLEMYEGEDERLRIESAMALGQISSVNGQYVPQLLEGLESERPLIREASAKALGEAGYHGRPALSALFKLEQDDPEPNVRAAARDAGQAIKAAEAPSNWMRSLLILLMLGLVGISVLIWMGKFPFGKSSLTDPDSPSSSTRNPSAKIRSA